jgi:hypothetical protein
MGRLFLNPIVNDIVLFHSLFEFINPHKVWGHLSAFIAPVALVWRTSCFVYPAAVQHSSWN